MSSRLPAFATTPEFYDRFAHAGRLLPEDELFLARLETMTSKDKTSANSRAESSAITESEEEVLGRLPPDVMECVFALQPYCPVTERELPLQPNQRLHLLDDQHPDWWLVRDPESMTFGFVIVEIVEVWDEKKHFFSAYLSSNRVASSALHESWGSVIVMSVGTDPMIGFCIPT